MNLFYYPPASRNGYPNPYSIHYKKALEQYYNVLDKENRPSKILSWTFLVNTFLADIFIINWLESVPFLRFGYLQYVLARIGLKVIQWRKKKIIWRFHNKHPHQGDNKQSRKIQDILFRQSQLIISHSEEAAEYARLKVENKVIYKCHPIMPISVDSFHGEVEACDVLIWGAILPYKGIYEFISNEEIQNTNLRIRIIGRCSDNELCNKIRSQCNQYITFENRRIDFNELAVCISKSRYVLFPYIGDCVSSSGALIDTIALGGIPVGPHIGAFKDLEKEGVCITYKNNKTLLSILQEKNTVSINKSFFMKNNSWESFVRIIKSQIIDS